MDIGELESKKITELREMAKELEIPGFSTMKKQGLVYEILRANAQSQGYDFRGGVL
jgi:transcription termination factor Rho